MANIIIKPGDQAADKNAGKRDPAAKRLQAMIIFILGKAGVPVDRVNECLAWAFGPDAWFIAPAYWPDRWNRLHPNSFKAKSDEKFVDFMYVVGFNYCTAALRLGLKEEEKQDRTKKS